MNAANEASAYPAGSIRHRVTLFLLFFFVAFVTYVLSYGPVLRLTCNVTTGSRDDGTRTFHEATFPEWGQWTEVIYRPLMPVEDGRAGALPRRFLSWYANLWVFGHRT
jgi:hypothetical protein